MNADRDVTMTSASPFPVAQPSTVMLEEAVPNSSLRLTADYAELGGFAGSYASYALVPYYDSDRRRLAKAFGDTITSPLLELCKKIGRVLSFTVATCVEVSTLGRENPYLNIKAERGKQLLASSYDSASRLLASERGFSCSEARFEVDRGGSFWRG